MNFFIYYSNWQNREIKHCTSKLNFLHIDSLSYLHIPGIWYVIEDCPESLHGIYSINLLQIVFVFLGGCARDGSVNSVIVSD